MSTIAQKETLGGELYKVAQYMSAWTHNAALYPEQIIKPRPLEQIFRPGRSRNVYVERAEIEKAAANVLSSVVEGEAVELVAGTGTGKSTALPVRLACRDDGIGIVIAPHSDMNTLNCGFIKRNVTVGRFGKCTAAQVYEIDGLRQLAAPAVAYMSASDFLMMFAQNRDLFSKVKVSYVYIDEAHEHLPQYIVLRLLIAAKWFEGTRVFFGSATNSDQNMESRIGGVSHVVKSITPDQFPYEEPERIPNRSPAHQKNIEGRTLVFVPGSDCFPVLADYYSSHGLPVLQVPEYARAVDTARVMKQLKQAGKRPLVVLITSRHETSYTMDADVTIDSGVTRDMVADPDTRVIKFVDRFTTESECKQRAGRVGRHLNGKSFFVQPDDHSIPSDCIPGTEIYVVLWCMLFSVKTDTELYRTWYPVVKSFSVNKVALLLVATIHPLMLAPFMDDEGDVAPGTRVIFKNFLSTQRRLVTTSMSYNIELTTDTWQEQVVTLPCLPVDRRAYKTDYKTPASWGLWSAVMYHAATGWDMAKALKHQVDSVSEASDSESDIASVTSKAPSIAVSEATVLPVPVKPVQVMETVVETVVPKTPESTTPSLPAYTSPSRSSRVAEYVSSVRSERSERKDDVRHDHLSDLERLKRLELHSGGSRELQRTDSDLRSVTSRRSGKSHRSAAYTDHGGGERYSSGSSRGYDPVSVDKSRRKRRRGRLVEEINASDHALLDPDDERLQEKFWRMVFDGDVDSMYKALKDNTVTVSSMNVVAKTDAFLKVLCAYNATVSDILQLKSVPDESFATRISKKLSTSKLDRRLGRVIGLLQVFRTHGYLLRYRTYKEHAGEIPRTGSPDHAKNLADYVYTLAPESYRYVIDNLNRLITQVYVADRVVGIGVKHRGGVYMAHHVASRPGAAPLEYEYTPYEILHSDMDEDVEIRKYRSLSHVSDDVVKTRPPRPGEPVVVMLATVDGMFPYGWYKVTTVGVVNQHSGRLPPGASGAPLIAVNDGAWVGIHVGSTPLSNGDVHGRFALVHNLLL